MCVIYLFMCVYLGFADWVFYFFYCVWNSWLKDISFFDGWWPDTSVLVAEDVRVSGCHTHTECSDPTDLHGDLVLFVQVQNRHCRGLCLITSSQHFISRHPRSARLFVVTDCEWHWTLKHVVSLKCHNMVLQRPQTCVVCFVWSELSFSLFQMHLHILRWVSDALCKRLLWDGMDPFISRLHNHAVWYVMIILDTKVIVH